MLTPGQIAHFETFGFVILRQVFTAEEVTIINREVDEIFAEDRDGGLITDEGHFVQPFFERKPYLSSLVADDRIYNIGVDLLGPDFILGQTEGRSRVGETPWHDCRCLLYPSSVGFPLRPQATLNSDGKMSHPILARRVKASFSAY